MDSSMVEIVLNFASHFLPWLISTAALCGAMYMAVRKDIARAIRTAEGAYVSAGDAHKRIDVLQTTLIK